MRVAQEPVKLRIANVSRFRHLMRDLMRATELGLIALVRQYIVQVGNSRLGWRAAILALKNTANIDIFARIAPFRGISIAASGNIDENRSLPYKPRQQSAMTRSDRGGLIWAGNGPICAGQHHRTYLIIRQIARSAERTTREADLS